MNKMITENINPLNPLTKINCLFCILLLFHSK